MTIEKDSTPPIPNWLLANRAVTDNDKNRLRLATSVCAKFEGVTLGHLIEPGKNPQAQRARATAMHLFVSLGLATQDDTMELFGCTRSEIKKADEEAETEPFRGVTEAIRPRVGPSAEKENRDRSDEIIPRQEVADAVCEVMNVTLEDIGKIERREDDRRGPVVTARQILTYLLQKLSEMNAAEVVTFLDMRGAAGSVSYAYKHMETLMSVKLDLPPDRQRLRENVLRVCKKLNVTERGLRIRKIEEPRLSKAGTILKRK